MVLPDQMAIVVLLETSDRRELKVHRELQAVMGKVVLMGHKDRRDCKVPLVPLERVTRKRRRLPIWRHALL